MTAISLSSAPLEQALRRMGLVQAGEVLRLSPLTGGVSSDIHLAEVGSRSFCIKRALPKLKVAAHWEAPVSRNSAEAAWFRAVKQWIPDNVPEVLGEDLDLGMFAMTYFPPGDYPVWKAQLMAGDVDPPFAAAVGTALATFHACSAGNAGVAAAFANDQTFEAIRLEPYLRTTALRHPDLAEVLHGLADRTAATRVALVHGDVSPKNILRGPEGPVFLDAECAWYGDPAFDLAFCLNHLLLKGAWRPDLRGSYLIAFYAMAESYLREVTWEPRDKIEARCARLLPGLFLARVDGKSPVEYLVEDAKRDQVRRLARHFLHHPTDRLGAIAQSWEAAD